MPTSREVSKIKSELIFQREQKIKGSLELQQQRLYESLLSDFVKVAKDKVDGNKTDIYKLQRELNKQYELQFPDVLRETVKASLAANDLNQIYFSSLVDSNRLDEIKDKTVKVINRSLGMDENNKIKTGGFMDRALEKKTVQKSFAKEVNTILSGSPDIVLMQTKLKEFITGTKGSTGLLERYYRTFANDLISNIDRTGSLVYANELELNNFYYGGGLLLSSRSFCVSKNGKIFSRAEAENWKDSAFITSMYGSNLSDYEPLINMGGYGCKHRADWITDELAKDSKKEVNAKAKERNANFKEKQK